MMIPDKLRLISKISEGNFWEVLLCENTYLANRKEAVKYIKTQTNEELTRISEIKRNLFESSVLAYLRKSKYIVEIYDAEILKDWFRINMEFLEEGSIQWLLNKKIFLNAKQVLKILECVLHALEYAHNKGILHLDIKPGNILIKNENIYKLSDFWLSSIRDKNWISSFREIYTIHIPPEKLSNSKIEATEQSDIYMLWITIYRLLNGNQHLLNQCDALKKDKLLKEAIISGNFPSRKDYLPHVHKRFRRIINKCINTDLQKRYKTIREIRSDISKIKIIYTWVYKNISNSLYHWECYKDNKLYLELLGEKWINGMWEISLMKYGNIKKVKISKYSYKWLQEKDFYEKLNDIFDEYF